MIQNSSTAPKIPCACGHPHTAGGARKRWGHQHQQPLRGNWPLGTQRDEHWAPASTFYVDESRERTMFSKRR